MPNRKFFTIFPFDRILKRNLYFNLILSTIKRKMKQRGNFALPIMLQSVAWLSFSVFSDSVIIEN